MNDSLGDRMQPRIVDQMPIKHNGIQQMDLKTQQVIATYSTALEAQEALGLRSGARNKIYECLNGRLENLDNIIMKTQEKDALGTRMKEQYEVRTRNFLPRRTTTLIRLDGKAFHSYTKGLKRPYDLDLMEDMDLTAKFLCENVQGTKLAYVQSDEITLVLTDFEEITTDAWFDGNVQKITSISAAMCTAKFNQLRVARSCERYEGALDIGNDRMLSYKEVIPACRLAFFDSRVFTIPDPTEVENCLIWRQQDATRNSISMAAQSMFSHKELHGVNSDQMQEMMWSKKGVNWNDYPEGFKRGRCVVKKAGWKEIPNAKVADNQPIHVGVPSYEPWPGMLCEQDGKIMVARSEWTMEAPPVFTQDRDYLRCRIPRL